MILGLVGLFICICGILYCQKKLEEKQIDDEILSLKNKARLKWLHDCSSGSADSEGYEWGIYRIKWENGRPVSVLQTNSDFSDLDAEMAREQNE